MQIELKVSKHPSGRFTLMQRNQNDMSFSDVQEPALFGNDDSGQFYKAVAARLARLHAEGHDINYEDANY